MVHVKCRKKITSQTTKENVSSPSNISRKPLFFGKIIISGITHGSIYESVCDDRLHRTHNVCKKRVQGITHVCVFNTVCSDMLHHTHTVCKNCVHCITHGCSIKMCAMIQYITHTSFVKTVCKASHTFMFFQTVCNNRQHHTHNFCKNPS